MFRDDKEAREIANDELEKEIKKLRQEKEVLQNLLENKKRMERTQGFSTAKSRVLESFDFTKQQIRSFGPGVLVVGAVIGLCVFLAYSWPSPRQVGGFVTNMHHHHSYTSHYVTCTGHPVVCTPHSDFHPERWEAVLCNEGECTTASYSDSVHWNQVHVGDWLCFEDHPDCARPPEHEEMAR